MFLKKKLMIELLVRVVDVAIGWVVWCMIVAIKMIGMVHERWGKRVDTWS
jgi:hypothetical protein